MKFENALKLFQHLLQIDDNRLEQNLNSVIAIDHPLHAEAAKLIDAHRKNQRHTLVNDLISGQAEVLVENERITRLEGSQLEQYKLTKKLGQGGMGVVYLGERNDGQLEQRVAIKFVYPSIVAITGDTALKIEAQHLANLKAPNIARIYNLAQTDDGLPYMIMEYVNGTPIDQYCKESKLSLEQRLSLFSEVANSVHCAHQNMIIHADIKPSNILIDASGNPKLLDFGIARTTNRQDAKNSTGSRWNKGYVRAASHEFASPEQIEGQPLTIASDIYALGQLLNVLIPSSQRSAELNAICDKATHVEAQKRFETVTEFANAITQVQDGTPILWYRNDAGYRFQKFIQRAPFAAVSSLVIPALIMTTLAFYFYKNKQLVAESTKNQQILAYYESLLMTSAPSLTASSKLTAAELIKHGAQQARQQNLHDEQTRSRILLTLATSLFNLGELTTAHKILQELDEKDIRVAVLLANIHLIENKFDAAETITRQILATAPREHSALILMARLEDMAGNTAAALKTLSNIERDEETQLQMFTRLRLHQQLLAKSDRFSEVEILTAMSDMARSPTMSAWYHLFEGERLVAINKTRSGKQQLRQAVDLAEAHYSQNHPELAALYEYAAEIYRQLEDWLNVEMTLNHAQSIYKNLTPNYDYRLVNVYLKQIHYYNKHDMQAQARAYILWAMEICETTASLDCQQPRALLAQNYFHLSDFDKAIATSRLWLEHAPRNSQDFLYVQTILAKSLIANDSADRATIIEQFAQDPSDHEALVIYIDLKVQTGQAREAIEWWQAQRLQTDTPQLKLAIANAYLATGQKAQAHNVLTGIDLTKLTAKQRSEAQLLGANLQGHPVKSSANYFHHPLPGNKTILATRHVNAVTAPAHGDELTIGKDYRITWQKSKMPGSNLSLYINHKINLNMKDTNSWHNVKNSGWHLAAQDIENTGELTIDPYHFMANGIRRFKVLLVSELGYWSLNPGLFTIKSGVSVDNGLEHVFLEDYLVDVVEHPAAYSIYQVGEPNRIKWDHIRLGGDSVALYVLHDNPANIGDRLSVDVDTLHNKRWYMITNNIPNTGHFEFDPALFNGRGNNYKLLLISDNKRWAVSNKRFSVVNPY